jgi:putative DNA primase/helicase
MNHGSEDVPERMKEYDNWLIVDSDKEPVHPPSDTTTVARLLSFEQAVCQLPENHHLGFQFSETPFVGIDYDNVAENREIVIPGFREHIDGVNTYAEWSQSGTGIHQIAIGELLEGFGNRVDLEYGDAHVEIYDTERYFVITGDVIEPHTDIEECTERIEELHRHFPERSTHSESRSSDVSESTEAVYRTIREYSKTNHGLARKAERTLQLWEDEPERKQGDSSSQDDLSFCNLLYFWCKGDAGLMEQCVRSSSRWDSKWSRDDYRKRTIQKAIEGKSDTFRGRYC